MSCDEQSLFPLFRHRHLPPPQAPLARQAQVPQARQVQLPPAVAQVPLRRRCLELTRWIRNEDEWSKSSCWLLVETEATSGVVVLSFPKNSGQCPAVPSWVWGILIYNQGNDMCWAWSVVLSDCFGDVSVMFPWCLSDVPVVSWWCFGDVSGLCQWCVGDVWVISQPCPHAVSVMSQ